MKQLLIIVKPNAPKTKITQIKDLRNGKITLLDKDFSINFETATEIKLDVAAPPEHNKANIEVIKFLSKYFDADVRIVSGLKAKRKIIAID